MRLYDEKDRVAEEYIMMPGGEYPMIQVEAGRCHSLEELKEGTVVFEAKDGRYEPLSVMSRKWSNRGKLSLQYHEKLNVPLLS